ncbi:hypothetical protein HBB16_04030 [Pseudonocardia sp. MCCB 268]|nr:hypothetical protein [Pseudonocardia cytotoxica]
MLAARAGPTVARSLTAHADVHLTGRVAFGWRWPATCPAGCSSSSRRASTRRRRPGPSRSWTPVLSSAWCSGPSGTPPARSSAAGSRAPGACGTDSRPDLVR